ncbi:anti-sigma factor antagonist [Streptomyces sp. NPDC004096]|uniref:anti-sigma factor antagonist n=1 Tax=unclassified Streptomyces TaxID=2593676 RepID=UPI0033BD4AD4
MHHDPAPLTRHLRIHRDGGHLVLEFHGEIDVVAASEITPFLDSATGRPAPRIVIDLRPVEFFDCSGLRLLFRARRRVLAQGGTLHLVCTEPLILRILRITGLAQVLPPSASVEEALSRPEAAGSVETG